MPQEELDLLKFPTGNMASLAQVRQSCGDLGMPAKNQPDRFSGHSGLSADHSLSYWSLGYEQAEPRPAEAAAAKLDWAASDAFPNPLYRMTQERPNTT